MKDINIVNIFIYGIYINFNIFKENSLNII